VYGPLCNGASTLVFESTQLYPDASRYWDLVERHKVTHFYTAPTATRALMKFGDEPLAKHDVSSLRVRGSVGEPIGPAPWKWYFEQVGLKRCELRLPGTEGQWGGGAPGGDSVQRGRRTFRLLVTGTPLQNNLHELWALLNFLLAEVFGDAEKFEEYFNDEGLVETKVVEKLHAILRPFMLRRLNADVEKSLPPKREIKLYTGMSEMQEYWYKTVLNRDVAVLNQLGGPDRAAHLEFLQV
jgi:hypothetical protein